MKSWISHFRLAGDPFGDDPAGWHYYYGACYGIASLRLERAFEQPRGYVLVTGPAGTGKSTLVRSVLARVPVYSHAVISAAHRAPAAVIEVLLRARVPSTEAQSDTRKRAALLDMLEHARAQKKPIVCVIEDAHLAHVGQLRDLFTAVNLAPDAHQLLQLVLVGRPKLIETLESHSLDALRTRIAMRQQMTPLNSFEVADYLRDRLEAAGADSVDRILPPVTMRAIAQASRGVIALCEAIARRALERAAATDCRSVTTEIVEEVASIYAPPATTPSMASLLRRLPRAVATGPVAAVVALALVVAAVQVSLVRGPKGTIEAGLAALAGLATTPTTQVDDAGPAADDALAQRRRENMRRTFLAGTPYETEIPPPPRPSTATPAVETPAPPPSAVVTPPPSSGMKVYRVKPDGSLSTETVQPPLGAPTAPDAAAPSAEREIRVPPPPPLPTPVAVPPGGSISLQVGAFRELKSAADLRARLQISFNDVYISTIDSGGEPLYRVRVGHFRAEVEADRAKTNLQNAGYPSFRVPATD